MVTGRDAVGILSLDTATVDCKSENQNLSKECNQLVSSVKQNFMLADQSPNQEANKYDSGELSSANRRRLLDAISKSGCSESDKRKYAHAVERLSGDWKISLNDFFKVDEETGEKSVFLSEKTPTGTRYTFKAIYTPQVDKETSKPEKTLEVSVKGISIAIDKRSEMLPSFLREVYLQMDARHERVMHTYGGNWTREAPSEA